MTATEKSRFTPDQGRTGNTELDLTTSRGVTEAIIIAIVTREAQISWRSNRDVEQEELLDGQLIQVLVFLTERVNQFSYFPGLLDKSALRQGYEAGIAYWDQYVVDQTGQNGDVPYALSATAKWRRLVLRGKLDEVEGRRP